MLLDITRQTPLLPQTSSETKRNNLIDASDSARTLRNFSTPPLMSIDVVTTTTAWLLFLIPLAEIYIFGWVLCLAFAAGHSQCCWLAYLRRLVT
jgi:hypothetical protein